MKKSLLYPQTNQTREAKQITGFWKFAFDPNEEGMKLNYPNGFQSNTEIPVPASFNEFFLKREERDYTGTFWYEKDIYLKTDSDKQIILRFSAATHDAVVFVNGMEVGRHRGGFLPFEIDITSVVKQNKQNKIVVKMNNELSHLTLPAGEVDVLPNGRKIAKPYFDFYNYAGLIRPVWILEVPKKRLVDIDIKVDLEDSTGVLNYNCYFNVPVNMDVELSLSDETGKIVATASGKKGRLVVKNPHLWEVLNAYLYQLKVQILDNDELVDEYMLDIGFRTIEIKNSQIYLNNHPVYLKGFGKHEDTDFYGRGYNPAAIKRDFELMKWSNANSFRTSHYPYSEEIYQLADKEGFLIIDEVPAVGFMQSTQNFLAAGEESTQIESFFAYEGIDKLQEHHLSDISDLIQRDKNHPSVIAWSLMNEPDTSTQEAKEYFEPIFEAARLNDPQKRPRTFTLILKDTPEVSKCYQYADFLCLNRYYGWYFANGDEFVTAKDLFDQELQAWHQLAPDKPIILTEFGADAINGLNQLPATMWTEGYQLECVKMCNELCDKYDFMCGEQIWNFADFETTEGIMRVGGNKKGVFTRARQPKQIAYYLKDRWQDLG